MANIKPLLAKILIQVGADEPKEIGTIEIPINVTIPEAEKTRGEVFNINVTPSYDPAKMAADLKSRLKFYGP